MREINNNSHSSINFQGVKSAPKAVENDIPESEKNIEKEVKETDLRNMPTEVIGRSQVPHTALEKDINFLLENYEDAEKANRFCEYLIEQKGMEYEHAAELATEFAKEFARD